MGKSVAFSYLYFLTETKVIKMTYVNYKSGKLNDDF